MRDQNTEAATLQEAWSKASHQNERLHRDFDDLRQRYGKTLRRIVRQRAERIVRKHSLAWGVEVDVRPLHNHSLHATRPHIHLRWQARGHDIRMDIAPTIPIEIEQFLHRFELIVKASAMFAAPLK